MKNKLLIIPVATLGVFAIAAGVFASTGLSNSPYPWMNQMHQAMLSDDYNTWKTTADQYGMGQMMNGVNQANFSQMDKMHDLMIQGNYNEANKIHQNLGMGNIRGGMMGGSWR